MKEEKKKIAREISEEDKKVFDNLIQKEKRRLSKVLIFKIHPQTLDTLINFWRQDFVKQRTKVWELFLTKNKGKYVELMNYSFYCLGFFKEEAFKDELVIFFIWFLRTITNNKRIPLEDRKKAANSLRNFFKILIPNLKGKEDTPDPIKLCTQYNEEFRKLKLEKIDKVRNQAYAKLRLKEMYPGFNNTDVERIVEEFGIRNKALLVVGIKNNLKIKSKNNRITGRLKDWISKGSVKIKREERLSKEYRHLIKKHL